MDFHIITPRGAELVMRVVDGVLEVVPMPAEAIMERIMGEPLGPSQPAVET